jgi:hypothetical protein
MISYEETLREFQKQKIKYDIRGGMIINSNGLPGTDIFVDMTDKNYKKVFNIFKKKGYSLKQPMESISEADNNER